MKKIFLFLSLIAALGVATNSCISKIVDEGGDIPTPPGEKKYIYFLRLSLNLFDNMSSDSPILPDWSAYPDMGFLLEDEDGNMLHSNKKIDITRESGYGDILLPGDSVITDKTNGVGYGYAPHSGTLSGKVLQGYLNPNQDQVVSGGIMDNTLRSNMTQVANPVTFRIAGNEGTCPLNLKNIFSVIKVTVEDASTPILPYKSVQSVELYIADKNNKRTQKTSSPLAGGYTINVRSSNPVAQFSSPSYMISATVKSGSNAQISSKPVFYFVVNPFTLQSNETLIACVKTNGGDVFYAEIELSPAGNSFYSVKATASEENTYLETTDEKYLNTYSNCYIISKKGKYIFPIDRTIGGQPLAGNTVVWLWASKEGGGVPGNISELMNPSSIGLTSVSGRNRITFQVGDANPFNPMKKGNVILALKNAINEIVWTWHIWITDDPQDVVLRDGKGVNKTFIDRNIGAFSAEMVSSGIDNYGFVYQWGRKDPFYGGDGNSNEPNTDPLLSFSNSHTLTNLSAGGFWIVNSATAADADFAKKNPMRFFCNLNMSLTADWLNANDSARWSDTKKTDNDPCPYGYKVPSRDDLQALQDAHAASKKVNALWYFCYMGHRHWDYFHINSGINSWPAAGMRLGRSAYLGNKGGQLINSGTAAVRGQCFYWTSTPVVLNDNSVLYGVSHRIQTSIDPIYGTDPIDENMGLYSRDEYGDNADAYPIRCVKIVP